MRNEEFNIVVASNTTDGRNTGGHFYNRLSAPLNFGGKPHEWQVGIKKLIYYNNFTTVIDEKMVVGHIRKREYLFTTHDVGARKVSCPNENIYISFDHRYISEQQGEEEVLLFAKKFYLTSQPSKFTDIRVFADYKLKTKTKVKGWHSVFENTPIDNVRSEENNEITTKYSLDDIETLRVQITYIETISYDIPSDYYNTVGNLLSAIPKIDGLSFQASSGNDNLVTLAFSSAKISWVELQNQLGITLGFKDTLFHTSPITAKYTPQLNRGRFAFFIYSNLCDFMKVGDSEAQLLDVITIPKAEFGVPVSINVFNPLYRPVCMNLVHDIEIALHSDSGEAILFDNKTGNAKTLFLLHFRKNI